MKKLLASLALATPLVALPVLAASVTPSATYWKSSLTEPTPLGGSDFTLTKSSSAQIKVGKGTVTIQLKLNGVLDGGAPVTQADNTLEVQLRYGGINRTVTFVFDLTDGKTNNAETKFVVANASLPAGGVEADDSIEVVRVRCLQGGVGPGAGQNFCSAGLTAK